MSFRQYRFTKHAKERITERMGPGEKPFFLEAFKDGTLIAKEIFRGNINYGNTKRPRTVISKNYSKDSGKHDCHVIVHYNGENYILMCDYKEEVIMTVLSIDLYKNKRWAVPLEKPIKKIKNLVEHQKNCIVKIPTIDISDKIENRSQLIIRLNGRSTRFTFPDGVKIKAVTPKIVKRILETFPLFLTGKKDDAVDILYNQSPKSPRLMSTTVDNLRRMGGWYDQKRA